MSTNPSKQKNIVDSATQRKNSVNDPGFSEKLGYYPYDLSHIEILTPLFGFITPSMNLITTLGDRHVVHDNLKTLLQQIPGNFMNTVNQYSDSFFVSNRTLFPNNWDKLIPNPNKGDDLPNSALPVVPLTAYLKDLIDSDVEVDMDSSTSSLSLSIRSALELLAENAYENSPSDDFDLYLNFGLGRLSFYAYILSRGNLLDYLGFQFDTNSQHDQYVGSLQYHIDNFMRALNDFCLDDSIVSRMTAINISPIVDFYDYSGAADDRVDYPFFTPRTKSEFRHYLMTTFERGTLPRFIFDSSFFQLYADGELVGEQLNHFKNLMRAVDSLINALPFSSAPVLTPSELDVVDEPFANGKCYNISKVLAYQQVVAQYFTNDSVDNIFTSELYMQLLRGVMYPSSEDGFSSEPTFNYNGVPTEYDYISYAGFYHSLLNSSRLGWSTRQILFGSIMFLLRKSLRYGDYFSTARTRMLAVGQLSIPISEDGMSVNPVDVTLNLVLQRYSNAVNRVGNKPLEYYSGMFNLTPSDMPSCPRYVAHRKIELQNRVTINTADNQGASTTNLVGATDNIGFDVFIDDFGVLLTLVSYDVLPIYNSGIDSDIRLADRFDYFNPMLQNIGDQGINLDELIGFEGLHSSIFGYTVRNKEYKYKLPRAHGAASWGLPGFIMRYPLQSRSSDGNSDYRLHINPDFIRDSPYFLDSSIPSLTGVSLGEYFHFIVSCVNEVKSARLIQKAPPILF